VVKDGYFSYQDDGGVAYCLRIRDGQNMWKARLPGRGDSWGSFLLSGDRIYTLSQAGETVVFKASPKGFEAIAHNKLEEKTNSSPVPSDGELFLRTHEALWCISD
jgi:outer membrane protein assembly factor BamB